MSKRKLAEKIFYTMKFKLFHVEANFVLFCCKKFIESYSNNTENIFKEKNNNVMRRVEFEKLNSQFKEDLVQASSLYYEFWNILYKIIKLVRIIINHMKSFLMSINIRRRSICI